MCSNFGFINTGCSTDARTSVEVSSANAAVSNLLQTSSNATHTSVVLKQDVEVILGAGGRIDCKQGFSIKQKISGEVTVSTDVKTDFASEVATSLQQQMQNTVDQMNSAEQGALASAIGASSTSDVKAHMDQLISNSATQATTTDIANSFDYDQSVRLEVYGWLSSERECTINQDIIVNIVASNIVSAISRSLATNQSVQDMANALTNVQKTKATGIFQDIFAGLAGLLGAFLLPLIIGVVAVAGVLIFTQLAKSKKKQAKQQGRDQRRIAQIQAQTGVSPNPYGLETSSFPQQTASYY